jgi:hypothetical protein
MGQQNVDLMSKIGNLTIPSSDGSRKSTTDAGASLHLSNAPAFSTHQSAFKEGRGTNPLIFPSFLNFNLY